MKNEKLALVNFERWRTDSITIRCYAFPAENYRRPQICIDQPPPSECPYIFEHAVAEGCVNIDGAAGGDDNAH